ncbi:MAG: ATP-dependent protease subunit HslV [Halanaerobiaceae bacterium]|nr:ATP-dependent protease subunit HslV [Halanaerobiaceae bacterium]
MNFDFRATTVLAIKHKGEVAMASDGQVTLGNTIMKAGAKKVRYLYNANVLAGFAGASADGFTLLEKFEIKLEEYHGNLERAAVELAKEWRTDKILRKLEALLVVGNIEKLLLISGNGDVIEPDNDIIAIGSGGAYAQAAALAMVKFAGDMTAKEIAYESVKIASGICIYTNDNIKVEVLAGGE